MDSDNNNNKRKASAIPADTPVGKRKKNKHNVPIGTNPKEKTKTILSKLAFYHFFQKSVTFDQISRECGYHQRTTSWLAVWKDIKSAGLVTKEDGGYRLTEEGFKASGARRHCPKTNEEHHSMIKSYLSLKGQQIFDILLKSDCPQYHKDIASALNVHHRSHAFSYGLKRLRELEIVRSVNVRDGGNKMKQCLKLSNRAYLSNPPLPPETHQGPLNPKTRGTVKPATYVSELQHPAASIPPPPPPHCNFGLTDMPSDTPTASYAQNPSINDASTRQGNIRNAAKKMDRGKDSGTLEHPKAKKTRVKSEKVQEVKGRIIAKMAENHKFGMAEISLDALAASVGYTNPRSDAISEALKLLKKDGLMIITNKSCKFTDKAVKERVAQFVPFEDPGTQGQVQLKSVFPPPPPPPPPATSEVVPLSTDEPYCPYRKVVDFDGEEKDVVEEIVAV